MKGMVLVGIVVLVVAEARAQPPGRDEGYERLVAFLGRSEMKRADGTIARGMSILGYLPKNRVYTYHGIGPRTRNEALRGSWRDGVLMLGGTAEAGARAERVRIGPFGEREVAFVTEVQAADGGWVPQKESVYVRRADPGGGSLPPSSYTL